MESSQFTLKHELLFCLLISIAIASIYGQIFNSEFISFDDPLYVVENSYVQQGLSTEGFKWAFSFQNKEGTYWHPLTWLSHMADVALFGNQAGLHHLMNVIWHMLNTCLLFLVLHRTTRMFWFSALTASFFAAHPLNVETVAWISERKNLLSTFFWLLSIAAYIFYTRSPSVIKYVLLVIVFVAGLMAKPMLVTLPFVFLLLDYWPLKRISLSSINTEEKRSLFIKNIYQIILRLLEKIPLICIAILVTHLVTESLNENNNVIAFSAIPLYLRAENLLVSYVSYLGKLIWPFGLAVFYPFPKSLSVVQVIVSTLLLGGITLAILGPLRERKHLTVGWLWFLGTLIPVSGLIQAGLWPAMADRWTYVPFIGLFVLLSWSIQEFLGRQRHKHTWSISVTILIVLAMGTISWHQVHNWQNSATLFSHALAVTSRNSVAHNNLGITLAEKDRLEEAISHYYQALAINPRYALALNNLGNALVKQDKTEEAIQNYLEALRLKPNFFQAHNNLGATLMDLERYNEAILKFKEALRFNANFFEAHNNLASAYGKIGSPEKAVTHYRKAMKIDAEKTSLYNFANALVKTGRPQEAIQYYKQVLKQNPDDEKAHYNLGVALMDLERYNEAILNFKEALRIKPDYFEAHNNLANIFTDQQQIEQAISHYLKAVEINPQGETSLINLANILAEQDSHEEAVSYFTQYLCLQPKDSSVHFNMAKELTELGRTEEAIEHYLQVITVDPDHYESLNNLALLFAQLGKNDSAIAHFNRALIIAPENAEIHYNLAQSLAAVGRAEEAKKHFASALDINPSFVNAHNNLGILLAQENRTEQAISHFAKALHLDPSSIDGHTNMGIILFNLGKKDEARYHFQEAVKLSPENQHLHLLLQKASTL